MLEKPEVKEEKKQTINKNYKTSDGRYETLFESVNAAAFLTTINGDIIEANQKSCELYGYGWDEIQNYKLLDIFPPKYDTKLMIEEITSKGGMNFESKNIKKDGTIFPVDISTSLFKLDKKPVMLTLIWDITYRKKAEEQLKKSEEKYRSIFENSAVAIMLTDKNEKIVSWNDYTEKLLGMGKKDLNLKAVETLYPQEEWLKIRAENIREKGMQHRFETKMYKKNGELLEVDISVSILRDENGEINGSIGIIKDISDRKKSEKIIKENEQKYHGLFECTTDGMIILDSRGEILDINCRATEIFKTEREKIIGNNFLSMDVLTSRSLPVLVKQFGDLLSNKKAKTHETEIRDFEGNNLNVEISSFFLVKKDNEVDNFVLIIRDISDRKQAEIKLAREHGLLQTLMDNIPDSVYFKDENSKFILVNKSKAERHNMKPEEMIGKTDFDFMAGEQAQKSFKDEKEIIQTGKYIINKIEKLKNSDGTIRWVSVTKVPRYDEEGNIIGTAGISKDITKWKKLEEEINKKQNK